MLLNSTFEFFFRDEICNSDLLMCPRCTLGHTCIAQPLKMDCSLTKGFIIFDNYATVFFAVFMSFWGNFNKRKTKF